MRSNRRSASMITSSAGRVFSAISIHASADMSARLNETHDAGLRSWVESANAPDQDFPIQNLPLGIFRPAGTAATFRGGVAIGDAIVDLEAACALRIFSGLALEAAMLAAQPSLNALM